MIRSVGVFLQFKTHYLSGAEGSPKFSRYLTIQKVAGIKL